jgi:hypothetical protein
MTMRTFVAGLGAVLIATSCSAQTISPGTLGLSGGINGAATSRQTITTTTPDPDAAIATAEVGFTSVTFGLEGTYYIGPRFGLGVLLSSQRLSIDVPEQDVRALLGGAYFGPVAHLRLPLDTRTTFVLSGSWGGIRTTIINRHTGLGEDLDVHAAGRYWLAGGGLSVALTSRTSIDASVRYQSSSFSAPKDAGPATTVPGVAAIAGGRSTSAGLLVGIGIGLYFR